MTPPIPQVSNEGARRQARLQDARLAVVTDLRSGGDLAGFVDACCAASVDIVVLRSPRADEAALRAAGAVIRPVTDSHGALFVVNDLPGLAVDIGADGVHVGQTDVPPDHARRVVGPDLLIGRTVRTPGHLLAASDEDVDYLVVGPVQAPDDGGAPVGIEMVRHAAGRAAMPWFASGGLTVDTVPDVLAAGASRVSVGRCLTTCDDVPTTAWALRRLLAGVDRR